MNRCTAWGIFWWFSATCFLRARSVFVKEGAADGWVCACRRSWELSLIRTYFYRTVHCDIITCVITVRFPHPNSFFLQTLWFRLFYWNVGVTSINEGCKNAHCLVGILLCYKAYIWGIPSVSTELLIWWWCLYREEWSARLWSRVFTVSRHQWRVCNTHAH